MSCKQEKKVHARFIDNTGDPDSLIYGCTSLDDRDRFEGYGVSADREREVDCLADWTVFVNDYDSFKRLCGQEDVFSEAEEALTRTEQQKKEIDDQLHRLRQEAREMLREYGSIEPSVISKGRYLASRLEQLQKWSDYNEQRLSAARDNLRDIEAGERIDPDSVPPDSGSYNTTHWNAVYSWGQALIDKLGWQTVTMSNGDLAILITQVKFKRRRREVTFEHFVNLVGLINAELYKRTGSKNFLRERDRMAVLWVKHNLGNRKNTAPHLSDQEVLFDPSERQFSDISISETELVKAIDLRSDAARLANRHNLTFNEAIIMLSDPA